MLRELNFTGVYHDEWMGTAVAYTFSEYDGFSGLVDPATGDVIRPMGSLALLTQAHEQMLIGMVRAARGVMVVNGHPTTATYRQYAQQGRVAGGPAGAILHFVEGALESRAYHTHLHTPMALLRFPGQLTDLDPLYNHTCAHVVDGNMTACLAHNIRDHLDAGVLPYLYDGLFPNASAPALLAAIYPVDPVHLAPGTVTGTNKTVSLSI